MSHRPTTRFPLVPLLGLAVSTCSPSNSDRATGKHGESCNPAINPQTGIADANLTLSRRDSRLMYLQKWEDDSGVVSVVTGIVRCKTLGRGKRLVPFSRPEPNQVNPACVDRIYDYAAAYNRRIASVAPAAVVQACGPDAIITNHW